jgi:hypothetical protein
MGLGNIASSINKAEGGNGGSKASINFWNGFGRAFTGYKTGGKVKKTSLALVHKNEYILPANAKPTKAQKAIVAKNKKSKK